MVIKIKTDIQTIEYNTETDHVYPLTLTSGSLYRSSNNREMFYVHGSNPIGTNCASNTFTKTEDMWDEETEQFKNVSYEVTEWITLLSMDEVIELFLKEINDTEVLIKDSEFLLRAPIVTKGIVKVKLENCKAHLEWPNSGFVTLTQSISSHGVIAGSVIRNNTIDKAPYNKYGSRHSKEYWPENTEYYIKVNKNDTVVNTTTNKRGYPGSCGTENKNKDVVIIVKNRNSGNMDTEDMITVDELNVLIEDAKKQGMKSVDINKKIFFKSEEELIDGGVCINLIRPTAKSVIGELRDLSKGE